MGIYGGNYCDISSRLILLPVQFHALPPIPRNLYGAITLKEESGKIERTVDYTTQV
jgi:hypothetical protein